MNESRTDRWRLINVMKNKSCENYRPGKYPDRPDTNYWVLWNDSRWEKFNQQLDRLRDYHLKKLAALTITASLLIGSGPAAETESDSQGSGLNDDDQAQENLTQKPDRIRTAASSRHLIYNQIFRLIDDYYRQLEESEPAPAETVQDNINWLIEADDQPPVAETAADSQPAETEPTINWPPETGAAGDSQPQPEPAEAGSDNGDINQPPINLNRDPAAPLMPASRQELNRFVNELIARNDLCRLTDIYDNWDPVTAYAVCVGESSGRNRLINHQDYHPLADCYGSYGLMQIGCIHKELLIGNNPDNWLDPVNNIVVANKLWRRCHCFQDWSAYLNQTPTYRQARRDYFVKLYEHIHQTKIND